MTTAAPLALFPLALLLVFSSQALAVPFHARAKALDVTGLNHACGVAVDSKGDLYASSAGESKVNVYDPSHTLLTSIADANTPCGLAVTSTGALYVSEQATGEVVRFKPNAYPFSGAPTYSAREAIDASGNAEGIATDRYDNRLYVAEGTKIAVYDSTGTFETNVGEGTLTEATGVAAFTHAIFPQGIERTERFLWVADARGLLADRLYLLHGKEEPKALVLRRELSGSSTPDGSFEFGAKGAYLAADPGNRNSEGKCLLIGEQACTEGHLYLYDAAHGALDDFDASGEYLEQIRDAGFADAEPTAVAIDRSSGANDGTLYVTAGAGAGGEALAFGPLRAPFRKVLKKPSEETGGLSQDVAAVVSVVTGPFGYVYASQASLIRVYKPGGEEVKTATSKPLLEDKFEGKSAKPYDLAVDSTCKVYVLDERGGFQGEELVAYYTPSACPPTSSTTYTRHEVANPSKFKDKDNLIQAIAVSPGPNKECKDRLFVTTRPETHEYDSAAGGSGLLDEKFAAGLKLGNRQALAVNGASCNVWFGSNPNLISEVDPSGKEILSQFENTCAANGKAGSNPAVAVEQDNNHVIAFDGTTSSAREYDAAGSCVAQFGTFTEGLIIPYDVAVDNACAIHEPPLSGKACEEFDPANDTAFVAFGDPSATHPPYKGVNAFGPLTYSSEPVKHKLTVERTGTGSGTVTSSPAGIGCGATCSAEYLGTEVVTLIAKPAAGSEFVKWTGCEAETASPTKGTCKVTMSVDRKVVAEFRKPKFKLTVKEEGTGSGTVTSSPAGIKCPPTCSAEFEEGTEVTLSASASVGSKFAGWSGSGCSGTGACKVTMSEAREVTATFEPRSNVGAEPVKVILTGSGAGKAFIAPEAAKYRGSPEIKCEYTSPGPQTGTCETFMSDEGEGWEQVFISAEAAPGSKFVGWKVEHAEFEACGTLTVCAPYFEPPETGSGEAEVTATFNLTLPKFKLTVKEEGTGSGTVTSSPAGIKCPPTCSAEFEEGTEVTLSASASVGSKFAGWSGSGCSGTGACKVTMSEAREVTATFDLEQHQLSVSKIGTGQGKVTSSPAGIDCGSTCSALFDHGTKVTLVATPTEGSAFTGWSGCESILVEPKGACLVTMSAAKGVTAEFKKGVKPSFALKVKLAGTGSGTVTSSPAGIKCPPTCSAEFEEGTEVTLSASASVGSKFAGWSGSGCSGTGACKVTMSEAREVTATFEPRSNVGAEPVKVILTGSGAGKAFIAPEAAKYRGSPEIKCEYTSPGPQTGTCETFMSDEGEGWEQVFIGFAASPGSELTGITAKNVETEACSNLPGSKTEGICTPYVEPPGTGSGEAEITAIFSAATPKPSLAIVKSGEGTVIADPAGIECGVTCEAKFEEGKTVTLLASPAADWAFSAWSGCTEHVGRTCKVLMDKDKTVKVTFVATPLLTVEKAGSGYGKVAATGISCDESCSKSTSGIKVGTAVTVKVTPAKGYEFVGFEGGTGNASSCSATCTFTISEASSVKVKFSPIPRKTMTVILKGPGAYKGKVTGKVVKSVYSPMISCGAGCTTATEWFFVTGETELVAAASTGYTFKGWTVSGGSAGTCTGTTSPCKLLTDANKTVEAKFE